jgi:hypothetical protein
MSVWYIPLQACTLLEVLMPAAEAQSVPDRMDGQRGPA